MNFVVKYLSILYLEDINFKICFSVSSILQKRFVLCRCQLAENILHFL